jgi:hypothetical protein
MTYSNPGDTVMDFTMGAGACGVSAQMTDRNFIGVEQDPEFFKIAEARINSAPVGTLAPSDKQLSTQLPDDVQTTPDENYEGELLTKLRNPTPPPAFFDEVEE